MIPALSLLGSIVGPAAAAVSPSTSVSAAATDGDAGFGHVLAQVSSDAVNSLKTGEATAILGLEGKASVQQVVESVMSAEQSLHTAIAIRDKAVSAYQSISQMAI
ncbi:flagellar hook-basal body complex protein FliE [Methylocella silvestris BL2]|uniref:Flagellar hook-basal body complex protein FliE n=1 Tax=Methylocella silvestris (strain DSM 15510 / CIP 108128 / LMG 27833 / NCIMB 13906 / BL2) TaxID=395965 RepID=B8EL14_METSB|nr:flagellar hook-basal body complex protein FliE [Methylocella silvestris]ACK49009.1 flagellar hook-basal body complex protein FliE [Methylocella silvestris BL2]